MRQGSRYMKQETQKFTLHTHTDLFDGKNTAQEMISAARDCGMTAIGISNHFIMHPDIENTKSFAAAQQRGYSDMCMNDFDKLIDIFSRHYDELRQMATRHSIRILCGLEVDFFNTAEWHSGFARAIKALRPDYIIGSGHFIEYGGTLCNVHDMANADPETSDKMLQVYWTKIQQVAQSGLFDWLAHLDLPKKRGLGMDEKWCDIEAQTIQTIADANARIEINTKGFGLPCAEPYPSKRILQHVAQYNIPVLLSDDAHSVDQIGGHFDAAAQLCRDCGITNFYTPDCVK